MTTAQTLLPRRLTQIVPKQYLGNTNAKMLKMSFHVCNHCGIHSTLINMHANQKLLVCQMQVKSIHLNDTCN